MPLICILHYSSPSNPRVWCATAWQGVLHEGTTRANTHLMSLDQQVPGTTTLLIAVALLNTYQAHTTSILVPIALINKARGSTLRHYENTG